MKISIITATHNRPHQIRNRCLPSILGQSTRDFEWVVINDGGDVETENAVLAASANISVKYFSTAHQGLIPSRNLGLDEASGDLVSFLDDDNSFSDTFVAKMLLHFERHPEIMMSVPVRRQRRDVYRNGKRVRKGKEFTRPLPGATNEDFVKGSFNAFFDSNGFVHRRNATVRFNPNLLIMSDHEYLLQCFSLWGLNSLGIWNEELVDYVQSSEGIIGRSSFEDEWQEWDYIWKNRVDYRVFQTVNPEPWLRDHVEKAKAKALAGEELPGFPQQVSVDD